MCWRGGECKDILQTVERNAHFGLDLEDDLPPFNILIIFDIHLIRKSLILTSSTLVIFILITIIIYIYTVTVSFSPTNPVLKRSISKTTYYPHHYS